MCTILKDTLKIPAFSAASLTNIYRQVTTRIRLRSVNLKLKLVLNLFIVSGCNIFEYQASESLENYSNCCLTIDVVHSLTQFLTVPYRYVVCDYCADGDCCSVTRLQRRWLVSNSARQKCCNTVRSGNHCRRHGSWYQMIMSVFFPQ